MRSVLAAEHAAQQAELREQRRRARDERRRRFPSWPGYEQWRRTRALPNLADQWRHRDTPGRVAFTDVGRRIDVHDAESEDAVLAALQLSARKWGRFRITGNDTFKDLCARLAAEHGFRITNPELQDRIREERRPGPAGPITREPLPHHQPPPRTPGRGIGD